MKPLKHMWRLSYLISKRWLRHHSQSYPVIAFALVASLMGAMKWGQYWWAQKSFYLSSWQNIPVTSFQNRSPAQGEEGTCLEDRYTLQLVQKQIQEEEAKWPKHHKITGQWQHLNLADVSAPMAHFLKHWKEYHPSSNSCKDIPCLINDARGEDVSADSGYISWYFYLKTGHLIHPNRDFSDTEYRNLWWLSFQWPQNYLHSIPTLVILKAPLAGERKWFKKEQYLYLNQFSLEDQREEHLSPKFMKTVTAAVASAHLSMLSEKMPSWRELAGWKREYLWQNGLYRERWVRGSEMLSAEELNYKMAQEAADFVVDPINYSQGATKQTYAFFKDHWYKREFNLAGIMNQEAKVDRWAWQEIKEKALTECSATYASQFVKEKPSRGLASMSYGHPVIRCMESKALFPFLNGKRNDLSYHHPKSCIFQRNFTKDGETLTDYHINKLETLLVKDLHQLEWSIKSAPHQWWVNWQEKQKVKTHLDESLAYFSCSGASDEKHCYRQTLQAFIQKVSTNRSPASLNEEMLDEWPMEAVSWRLNKVMGSETHAMNWALELNADLAWMKCYRQGINELAKPHSLSWISSGPQYVDIKFLNCLNESADKVLQQTVTTTAQDILKLNLNEIEAGHFIFKLKPILRQQWEQQIQNYAHQEKEYLQKQITSIESSLQRDLLKHLNTYPDMLQTHGFARTCSIRLTYHYPTRMYFHRREQLSAMWGQSICNSIQDSTEFQKQIQLLRKQSWQTLLSSAQDIYGDTLKDRVMKNCFRRTPATETAKILLQEQKTQDCIIEQTEFAWMSTAQEMEEEHALSTEEWARLKRDLQQVSIKLVKERL